MSIGLKIFPDKLKMVDQLSKTFDFIELMATPSFSKVKKLKLPVVIHSPHWRFGVNLADKNLEKRNLKLINHARKIADKFKSKTIVVHPGKIRNKNCSIETSINFLKKIDDPRIIIENLHPKYGMISIPEKLKLFTEELKCGICFDFAHAIITSHSLGYKSYKPFVKRFLKLKPEYFHVCDGYYNDKDSHLDLGEGNYDLNFIKECIGKKPFTLEVTSRTISSLKKQVELIV